MNQNYLPARNAGEEGLLQKLRGEASILYQRIGKLDSMSFTDRQKALKRLTQVNKEIERLELAIRLRTAAESEEAPQDGGFLPPRAPSASQAAFRGRNRRHREKRLGVRMVENRCGLRSMVVEVESEVLDQRKFLVYEPVGSAVGNTEADPFPDGGFLAPRSA